MFASLYEVLIFHSSVLNFWCVVVYCVIKAHTEKEQLNNCICDFGQINRPKFILSYHAYGTKDMDDLKAKLCIP